MTTIRPSVGDRRGERGIALLSVLLLLMLITALSGAIVLSGRTELLLSRNHQAFAQAEAAAEAGLNHGVQVVITRLASWSADGYGSAGQSASALLLGPDGLSGTSATDADNGRLDNLGLPASGVTLAGVLNSRYEVRVMDEDDPARGGVLPAAAQIAENDDPLLDGNERILVRSVGFARDNTTVTLEATLGPADLGAIVANGDIEINGNVTVDGTSGSVHANGDLELQGSVSVSEDATAGGAYSTTGNPSVGGTSGGGTSQVSIPPINPADYLSRADRILTSGGAVTLPDGTVECSSAACYGTYGWSFSGGTWSVTSTNAQGTYYVQGNVSITGNTGSNASPLDITIIATGSIDISGNPTMTPADPEGLFLLTGGDLDISGNLQMTAGAEGRILVHEQMRIRGNVGLRAQIIVEDSPSVATLVTTTAVDPAGNASITYNGTLGAVVFSVSAWREVR